MTYEELLELEEKMGSVSKGISKDKYEEIPRVIAKNIEEVCSICYYNIKDGEEVNELPCKHYYHVECIVEWLKKEKKKVIVLFPVHCLIKQKKIVLFKIVLFFIIL